MRPAVVEPFTRTQRISRSAALALYERELAYYRADAPYLTVAKAAERCMKPSFLLTEAQIEGLWRIRQSLRIHDSMTLLPNPPRHRTDTFVRTLNSAFREPQRPAR